MTVTSQDIFDWDAFMRDTLEASPAATGAWLRCLYKMRFSVTRGRLSWPLSSYARLFGTSQDQAKVLIDEIRTLGIGDAEIQSDGGITLTNRRMYRTFRDAELNRERQSRYRENQQNTGADSEVCNGEIIQPKNGDIYISSSSLNSSLKEKKIDKKEEEKNISSSPQILRVFTYWQTELNHPNAKLTNERRRYIATRLRDGYSVEDLETAIRGCKSSAFHMGQNDQGKVYDGIELIFKNGSNVERFIGYTRKVAKAPDPRLMVGAHTASTTGINPLCQVCSDIGELMIKDETIPVTGIRIEPCPNCRKAA